MKCFAILAVQFSKARTGKMAIIWRKADHSLGTRREIHKVRLSMNVQASLLENSPFSEVCCCLRVCVRLRVKNQQLLHDAIYTISKYKNQSKLDQIQ